MTHKRISISLKPNDIEVFDQLAERKNTERSKLIRTLIYGCLHDVIDICERDSGLDKLRKLYRREPRLPDQPK